MDYNTFVYDLKRYKDNLKKLQEYDGLIDMQLYIMSGVSAVKYEKIPSSHNPEMSELNRLEQIEKYNFLLMQRQRYETAVKNIQVIKARLPEDLWTMLKEKFIDGMTYEQIGRKYGYTGQGFWKMLRRETEKYL